MTLSEKMAAYVTNYKIDKDACARETAKYNFLDTIGCIIAGTVTCQFKLAAEYAARYSSIKESLILSNKGMIEAGHAALAHAVAAHACDYDDMCVSLNGHPSAVIVPVVLALGDRLDKMTSKVLEAYMVGVEIDSAFGRLFNEGNYSKAWNQTTALGIMGAVAAAGKIMELSQEEMTHAFGIAIGESSGNKANFGTMTKDLTVGMTALKAIKCAEFAKLGFLSNQSVIEGKNGFFQTTKNVVSSRPLLDFLEGRESVFLNPGLVIKPYPTCRGNHNVIDCMLKLLNKHALKASDIRSVSCKVQSTVMDTERYPNPQSGAEGKFSIAFCVALCILNGRLDTQDFQKKDITEPTILEQMAKVRVILEPAIQKARFGAEVTIETNTGVAYRSTGNYAKGDPLNPMSWQEVKHKFTYNASLIMPIEKAEKISDWLFHTDEWLNEKHILKRIESAAWGE